MSAARQSRRRRRRVLPRCWTRTQEDDHAEQTHATAVDRRPDRCDHRRYGLCGCEHRARRIGLALAAHQGAGEGARVSSPFTLSVDASVTLDDPSTGEHHVHLCFDGADCDTEYQLVYGNTFDVGDLPPGEHTIEASLRNADHSDAGVSDEITVTVGDGGTGPESGTASGGTRDGGLDY